MKSATISRCATVLSGAFLLFGCSSSETPFAASGSGGAGASAGSANGGAAGVDIGGGAGTANGGAAGTAAGGAGGAGGIANDGGAKDSSVPGSDASASCFPNEVARCTCAQGLGTRRCAPNGAGWAACTCATYGAEIVVAPGGSDAAAGDLAHPFASLTRARDAIRALPDAGGLPKGGVVVWLRGGTYALSSTFALTAADSGTTDAPVVYRGYPGETARIVGAQTIDPAWFSPVTSASAVFSRLDPSVQGKVVAVDMKAHGITDFGTLKKRGFCGGADSALDLFIDGAPMTVARWPDAAENEITTGAETASEVTMYGTLAPDVTGRYVKDSVQDGMSSFSRQGLVGGKQYHLYRSTWDYQGKSNTAWFLTTNATGYPSNTDPWWYRYNAALGPMDGSNGATGQPTTRKPDAIVHGFATIASTAGTTTFQYFGDRPTRWGSAPDAWMHGYWKYAWADCHEPVASIDTATKTVTLPETPGYGIQAGQTFYTYNLIEEISVPGEWYLDRTTGVLYLYPPGDVSKAEILVSMLKTPLVTITGASHVRVQDVVLEAGRTTLVTVAGGTDVVLEGVTLRNAGAGAATISGTGNGIRNAVIAGSAAGGVRLDGGDRATLIAGGNFVENSDIHDFGRWEWTYRPGVDVSGVGNRVAHNTIHDAPHSAVLYGGNEHVIELNEIRDVCRFSSDAGAVYAGRDWGARGNKVRHNFIHDIRTFFEGYGVHGIYLDDCLSGVEVSGNVLYRIQDLAIQHGGGRDDVMVNNVIARCGTGLGADKRGYDWFLVGNGPSHIPGDSWNLLEKLEKVGYQKEPWASRYPECAAIPDDYAAIEAPTAKWLYPEGCVFSRNMGWKNGTWISGTDATAYYKELVDNVADQDPLFVDESKLDLTLKPGSPALAIPGFAPIPFGDIGIRP
jgi:hypothetical protein